MTEQFTNNESAGIPHTLRIEPHEALARDFRTMIEELHECGFPVARIAYKCDVDRKTVRRWRDGESEPEYSKAIILIGLHYCWCGDGKNRSNVTLGIFEAGQPDQ